MPKYGLSGWLAPSTVAAVCDTTRPAGVKKPALGEIGRPSTLTRDRK